MYIVRRKSDIGTPMCALCIKKGTVSHGKVVIIVQTVQICQVNPLFTTDIDAE